MQVTIVISTQLLLVSVSVYHTCCNDDYHNICNWNNKTTTRSKKTFLFIPYLQCIIFETEI